MSWSIAKQIFVHGFVKMDGMKCSEVGWVGWVESGDAVKNVNNMSLRIILLLSPESTR